MQDDHSKEGSCVNSPGVFHAQGRRNYSEIRPTPILEDPKWLPNRSWWVSSLTWDAKGRPGTPKAAQETGTKAPRDAKGAKTEEHKGAQGPPKTTQGRPSARFEPQWVLEWTSRCSFWTRKRHKWQKRKRVRKRNRNQKRKMMYFERLEHRKSSSRISAVCIFQKRPVR